MARKKRSGGGREGSKSSAIRAHLTQHGNLPAKEIMEALKAQGVEVTEALINNVKYTASKKKTGGRKVGRPKGVKAATATHESGSVASLLVAKRAFDQLGGIAAAKKAIETLEKLR